MIVEEKNLSKITQQINFSLGVEKGYLPDSEDIIYISAMVGGGDTTELEMDMSKLDKTKSYVFFLQLSRSLGLDERKNKNHLKRFRGGMDHPGSSLLIFTSLRFFQKFFSESFII